MKLDTKAGYSADWELSSSRAPQLHEPERIVGESGREIQPWEIKLGKMIFYLTIAAGLWVFYWLNGIQCPC
ncbi:MAG: hypothetical protein U0236_03845 [Nitrospira sp.]